MRQMHKAHLSTCLKKTMKIHTTLDTPGTLDLTQINLKTDWGSHMKESGGALQSPNMSLCEEHTKLWEISGKKRSWQFIHKKTKTKHGSLIRVG